MTQRRSNPERLEELLVEQSLFGLPDDEKQELNQLMAGSAIDPEAFDRVAAIASLALSKSTVPLPEGLKQKILASYSEEAAAPLEISVSPPVSTRESSGPSSGRMNRREMMAWLIAAASMAGVVIDRQTFRSIGRTPPSPSDLREALLRREPDIVQAIWNTTDDPSARGATGDIVWSTLAQQGFLRISGLVPNEPYIHQYQLWIFDSQRDQRYPIDGGIFDINSKQAVTIVQIHPRLPVGAPTMFAVTIEKRGGVVVSTRERLLLVAGPLSKPV